MSAVALIPARAGSERVPGKNVKPLAGHPLLAYSIACAQESGAFDAIVVSTDDEGIAAVARRYGAEVPALRPAEIGGSTSPDIAWVTHMLGVLAAEGRTFDLFAILRPTSPFRDPATVRATVERLRSAGDAADSVRAVTPVRDHPGKMWIVDGDGPMRPLLEPDGGAVPMHSRQTKALPVVHVQDSSLEVAWTRVAAGPDASISGERVLAHVSTGHQGLSIDYPADWEQAERVAAAGTPLPTPRTVS